VVRDPDLADSFFFGSITATGLWRDRTRNYVLSSISGLGRVFGSVFITVSAVNSFKVVRVHVESVQDEALPLADRYSTEMLPGEFPPRNIRMRHIAGLETNERLIVSTMANRKSVFVR
jgi:hypothetical protein